MTCPYFSIRNERIVCSVYSTIEVTQNKVKECQSNSPPQHYCFEQAQIYIRKEAVKTVPSPFHGGIEALSSSGFFNRHNH